MGQSFRRKKALRSRYYWPNFEAKEVKPRMGPVKESQMNLPE